MDVQYSIDPDLIDWTELAHVFALAPLGQRDPALLERAFRNSTLVLFAYEGGRLIGAGRALSDGVWRASLYDVVVLPEYQGRGIGSELILQLIEAAGVDVTMLFAAPGKEAFYERFGFRRMKTAMAIMDHPEQRQAKGFIE